MTDHEHPAPWGVQIPIEFEPDDKGEFPLCQTVWVNHDNGHFYLRFYRIVPPLAPSVPDHIKAHLVGTVAIPAPPVPGIIRALIDNVHKYEAATGIRMQWEEPPQAASSK